MALTLPTVHLNGTSRKDLIRDYETAMTAVHAAFTALQAAAPNGRDYYPQGPDACGRAEDEHRARLGHLEAVHTELTEILMALCDGRPSTTPCPACHDGRRSPDEQDRTLTFDDNSVQVYCARCGRCLQA